MQQDLLKRFAQALDQRDRSIIADQLRALLSIVLFLLISEENKQSSPKSTDKPPCKGTTPTAILPLSSNSASSFPDPRLEKLVCPTLHTVLLSSALTPTNQNRRQLPTLLLPRCILRTTPSNPLPLCRTCISFAQSPIRYVFIFNYLG